MKKFWDIFLSALPVLFMIGLIPIVQNDYVLTVIYFTTIVVLLLIKRTRHDLTVLAFGFGIMILSEYLFVSTGVETFERRTLFGLMPLWLPFLWAYGFVVIKRAIVILDHPGQ